MTATSSGKAPRPTAPRAGAVEASPRPIHEKVIFSSTCSSALTHDYILFFTDRGKVYWLKVYDLPMATRTSGGRAMVNLLQLSEGEKVTGLIPVREFREDECLMMVTRRGTVKKTELTAFKRPLGRGIIALGLDEGDQLIGVSRTKASRPGHPEHQGWHGHPI